MDPGTAAVKQEGGAQHQPQHPPPSTSSSISSAAGSTEPGLSSDNLANGMAEFGDISEKDLVDFDDEDDNAAMDCND